jgi:ankyrin repeat protein
MKLFGKKDYGYAFDSLEHFVANDETSDATHLLETQPHLLKATNAQGVSALHIAALAQKPVMISIMLAHGADPNVRTSRDYHFRLIDLTVAKGSTPLHFAACVDVARGLINGGARPDFKNRAGDTPLAIAEGGWTDNARELCDYLRHRGRVAHIKASRFGNWRNGRRLLKAVKTGDLSNARRLSLGASQEVLNFHDPFYNHGKTVLGYAIWTKNCEMVEMLLNHGADPNESASEDGGLSPLSFARIVGCRPVLDLLEKRGATLGHQKRKYCTSAFYKVTPWFNGQSVVLYGIILLTGWGIFHFGKWLLHLFYR